MRRLAARGAFTLAELLTSMAIVALLAAVALPTLGRARERARQALCVQQLHQVWLALQAYANDFDSYPAGDSWGRQNERTFYGRGGAGNGYWTAVPYSLVTWGYLDEERALACPELALRHPERSEYLRYAYNGAAWDMGGPYVDPHSPEVRWLACCMYIKVFWDPRLDVPYPHGGGTRECVLATDGSVRVLEVPWAEEWTGRMTK